MSVVSTGWPPRFLAAKEAFDPVVRAAGYRFAGMERCGTGEQSATAEYRGRGRRLRLVYAGEEQLLWIDTATERDTQIISRWTDIEWILAGERLPANLDLSDDRIADLVTAAARFLVANGLPPAPSGTPPGQG